MRLALLFFLLTTGATAQTVTSRFPLRNTQAARGANVVVTLATPVAPNASLSVLSTQAGGKKAGTTTITGTTVTFNPTVDFKAGETVTATFASGTGTNHVWQFTAGAQRSSGFFYSEFLALAMPSPSSMGGAALADFNGDGSLDLVTSLGAAPPPAVPAQYRLAFNNGRGTMRSNTALISLPPNQFEAPPEVTDVDGDGDLDMLRPSVRGDSLLTLVNNGLGTFASRLQPLPSPIPNRSGFMLASGDFDGDGDVDIVTPRGFSSADSLKVGLNDGLGNFRFARRAGPTGYSVSRILPGDLDNDGDLDLVVYSYGAVELFLNDGRGGFPSKRLITSSNPRDMLLADFNGDGNLDLTVLYPQGSQGAGQVAVLYNNGMGVFGGNNLSPISITNYPHIMAAADMEGDGDLDLFVSRFNGGIHVLENPGTGLNNSYRSFGPGGQVVNLAMGDLDNDGDVDIAAPDALGTQVRFPRNDTSPTAVRPGNDVVVSLHPLPVPRGAMSRLQFDRPLLGTLLLHSPMGQLVRQQKLAGATADIATAGLAPGLYLLTVQADDQAPFTRRLVVE